MIIFVKLDINENPKINIFVCRVLWYLTPRLADLEITTTLSTPLNLTETQRVLMQYRTENSAGEHDERRGEAEHHG